MAVQAQHPSNAFSPDFRNRGQNNALEDLQMLQGRDNHFRNLFFGGYSNLGGQHVINNVTVFSDPQSELTCNASGSRKRNREEPMALPEPNQNQLQIPSQFRYSNLASFPVKPTADASVATGVLLSRDQTRLFESAGTSTSGRPSTVSSSAAVAPIAQDLISHFYQQNQEIDSLVRLQTERLRLGLEETRKRHCRALVSVLEQQVVKRLKEKETELEHVSRRNAELEEKIRQMSQENQIWFNLAKNNEAIVSSLRTSLEQVLLQNAVTAAGVKVKEGYGDSDGTPFLADDAQSCCFLEEERVKAEASTVAKENEDLRCRKACKVCREKDVSVLLLPCRHLCLCKDCETKVATCPICQTTKTACLQVFIS